MNDVQKQVLSIYKEVRKICEKHDLQYFAIGGTCLGAVRHKGFIPWDDDMDIAMPLDDYIRFYKIAKKELPNDLKVYFTSSRRHNACIFMKVYSENTTFIGPQEIPYPNEYKGIFVDIMPLYGAPASGISRKKYINRINSLLRLNKLRRWSIKNIDSLKILLLWIVLFPVNILLPYDFWSNSYKKFVSKYKYETSEYTAYSFSILNEKLFFPIQWFDGYIDMKFENTSVRCPIEYDKFLTALFGNYNLLPPRIKGSHIQVKVLLIATSLLNTIKVLLKSTEIFILIKFYEGALSEFAE